MKHTSSLLLCMTMATILIAGCSSQQSPTPQPSTIDDQTPPTVQEEKVKVGVILPISGPVSCYGEGTKNAMLLAQQEAGEKGQKLELIFGDDQYEVQNGLAAYKKFLSLDKIDYLYVWSANSAKALQEMVKKDAMPSLMYTPDETICNDNETCTRSMTKVSSYTDVVFDTIKTMNKKNIAVIDTQDERLQNFSTALQENNGSGGVSITNLDSFDRGETNFAGVVEKINQGQFDAVAAYLSEGSMGSFVKQIRSAGYTGTIFGSDYTESSNERDIAGDAMNGVMRVNTESATSGFIEKYTAQFGANGCLIDAVKSYDIFAYLFENYNAETDKTLNDTIKRMENYTAMHGTYTYTTDDLGDKYIFNQPILKAVINNELVENFIAQ